MTRIAETESFEAACFHVNFLKKSRDEDYDIIEIENINDTTELENHQ